jgi:TRAP-type C4-dicarboxylate transport system permease small subunit
LFGTVLAHLLEIAFYALMFWYADNVAHIGGFTGLGTDGVANYFYFSAETFTSLGMGHLYPRGALRLMTSLEVLNGLLLIGWSASFTFLAMSRLWELHATDTAAKTHVLSHREDDEP